MSVRRRPRRGRSTALIVADAGTGHSALRDRLRSVGRCSITVRHPLEVISCLQDESQTIGAVFCPLDDPAFKLGGLFAFLGNEFPWVRRITYANSDADCRDLLRARAKLDRHYRSHIHEAATAMGFSEEDADDIVQETLLGVFLACRTLGAVDRDALVGTVTAVSAFDSERRSRRREWLRAAVVRYAAIEQSTLESADRPDAVLLTAELADLASTAVAILPGWCQRPFLMRVVNGDSADVAGEALGMPPSTVDMRVRRARNMIGSDMAPHLA